MRIRNDYQLRKWLAREIHGRILPRKPPQTERRGPARDEAYRAWIRTLPCCACNSTQNVEAAHTGSDGGMTQKASDYSCVPLCADCHRLGPGAYHGLNSSAREFERRRGLDLQALAARLRAERQGRGVRSLQTFAKRY